MAEIRYNPMLGDWIMVASNRAKRPTMPKDFCPFCPGSGLVPDEGYDVYEYDNDFPVMRQELSTTDGYEGGFFKAKPVYGKCEVILYQTGHTITLPELPLPHIRKLVDLWCSRFKELSEDEKIKYIFIFENRGAESGTTMPHPHGQLYAFDRIPETPKKELANSKKYFEETGHCLICDARDAEVEAKIRVIDENDSFVAYLPYYTAFPYVVNISAKEHICNMNQFTDKMKNDFAEILLHVTGAFDNVFDRLFPYMMGFHQTPVNMDGEGEDCYHFHEEFYPPLRAANVQYFRASVETSLGAYCNVTSPEAKAQELREALERFLAKRPDSSWSSLK